MNELLRCASMTIAEEHLQIAAEIGRTNNISLSKLQELLTLFYTEDE